MSEVNNNVLLLLLVLVLLITDAGYSVAHIAALPPDRKYYWQMFIHTYNWDPRPEADK